MNTFSLNIPARIQHLVGAYLTAKEEIIRRGYAWEIDWQYALCPNRVTEQHFLQESAWVVFCSGFSESVLRGVFPKLSEAFGDWKSSAWILKHQRKCSVHALKVFGSHRKVNGVIQIAQRVTSMGFKAITAILQNDPITFLRSLPFMGPVTSLHLAKNLGLQVAKPDRHLNRVAMANGYCSPQDMCEAITDVVGDKVSVIDLVIWRYATLEPNYLSLFTCNSMRSGETRKH